MPEENEQQLLIT